MAWKLCKGFKLKFNTKLENIKTYETGKPIELVVREFGINPKDIIKLASNENPFGCSQKVKDAVVDIVSKMSLYPDDSMTKLKDALSKRFGVKDENIFFTGYPLPSENIGTENLEILKYDLKHRLFNLDPKRKYFEKYKTLIEENLGKLPEKPDHPLTIMFSVGGAGAQKEIGIKLLKCLRFYLKQLSYVSF